MCGERVKENVIGEPFIPQYIIPIDRTPHSLAFVAVMYLNRE